MNSCPRVMQDADQRANRAKLLKQTKNLIAAVNARDNLAARGGDTDDNTSQVIEAQVLI